MTQNEPVDYLAAINELRQEEQRQQTQIHDPDYTPPQSDEPVNYLAISEAWRKEQSAKHKIHLQTGKRNPSHDPVCREADKELTK